jgi:hypothetical protein
MAKKIGLGQSRKRGVVAKGKPGRASKAAG